MTVILDADLEKYFNEACPYNPLTKKPKSPPVFSTCLRSLEIPGVKDDLRWEKNGDIRRLAKLVEKGNHHSLPNTQKQAQAVADMVTQLHVFGEMSLADRSSFLAAAPLSLRTLVLRAYDLARSFLNFFRREPDEGRTAIVADAVNKLKTAIHDVATTNPGTSSEVPTRFSALYEDDKLGALGKKERSVYLAVMRSFSKDIQRMNFDQSLEFTRSIENIRKLTIPQSSQPPVLGSQSEGGSS